MVFLAKVLQRKYYFYKYIDFSFEFSRKRLVFLVMKKTIILFFLISIFSIILLYLAGCQNPLYGVGDNADVKNPKISVTSPANAATVGKFFTIKGTAWDDKKLDRITIESPGLKKKEFRATSSWTVDIDASGLTMDSHRFTITVTDKSGKKTTTYLNLNIDTQGPVISMIYPNSDKIPDNNGAPYKGNIMFKFSVMDNTPNAVNPVSSSDQFTIFKKDNPGLITSGKLTKLTDEIWSYNYNTGNNPAGIYTIRVYFYDTFGNKSDTFEKDIDLSPVSNTPVLTLEQPTSSTQISRQLIIYGYASDNNGVSKICYNIKKLDNTDIFPADQTINANNESLYTFRETVDTSSLGLANGTFKLVIWAIDNEGNKSDVVTSNFEIDNSIPYLQILDSTSAPAGNTPLNAKYLNGNFTIEAQCDFDDAAVDYKVTQNGVDTGWDPWGAMSQTGFVYSAVINFNSLYSKGFTDGAITVRLKAAKADKIYEVTRTFYIDKTPPQIAIISHTDNQVVNGAVTLSGTAYDSMGLGDKVEIFNSDPAINSWQDAVGVQLWSYVVSTDASDIETKFHVTNGVQSALFKVRVSDKAGNTTTQSIHLTIDPSTDIPKVVLLDPPPASSGEKVSGNLSILASMDDDDFPAKDMTGYISIYDGAAPVAGLSKSYTKATSGFPNMSTIIDTTALTDGKTYTIKIDGTDWHGKTAPEVTFNFQVDNNVPEIDLTQPVTDTYMRNMINFTGKVKSNNNIQGFIISYIDNNSTTQSRNITLTPAAPEGGKNVWTFNFTLNGSGADTGLTGTNIDWADDQWGNNPHLFTLRATNETGLMTYKYVTINLDNHNPTGSITYPEDNHIIDIDSEPTEILIKGGMNDTPSQGTAYPLNLGLTQLELWKNGSYLSTIKAFTDGTGNYVMPSTAENFTYRWNHSAIPDGSYAIRLYVKDNTNSVPVMADEVNIIKNAYPPVVNSITFATKDFYRGTVSFNVTGQDRGTLASGNGIAKVDMLVDGAVKATINHNPAADLSFNDNFNLDTSALADGIHTISFMVTDSSGLTGTKSAGSITTDNTAPVISAPVYYTLDYSPAITNYSTYLGFTVTVDDQFSLVGDNPQFRITTNNGTEILGWSYFNSQVYNGQKE